jgi:tRNA(adenine34) deaminase
VKWSAVPPLWQRCFELAWQAYQEGSNPIAALVADRNGRIVATGKSAVRASMSDVVVTHNELAHAEVNALLTLDNRAHDKQTARGYALYVTLEPCPLCFASFYMSDVGSLHYAARDRFGGSTDLMGMTPYLSRKARRIVGPVDGLAGVSIFLNVYRDLEVGQPLDDPVHAAMAQDYPGAVRAARAIVAEESETLPVDMAFPAAFERIVRWLGQHG